MPASNAPQLPPAVQAALTAIEAYLYSTTRRIPAHKVNAFDGAKEALISLGQELKLTVGE